MNLRVLYDSSTTHHPASHDAIDPVSRGHTPTTIIRRVEGIREARNLFEIADHNHFLYEEDFTEETVDGLIEDGLPHQRYERLVRMGDATARIRQDTKGNVSTVLLVDYPLARMSLEVALGMRLYADDQWLNRDRLDDVSFQRADDDNNVVVRILDAAGSEHILTLDPEKGYPVVRYYILRNDEIIVDILCSDFALVAPDMWLPHKISMHAYYYVNGQQRVSRELEYVVRGYELGRVKMERFRFHPLDELRLYQRVQDNLRLRESREGRSDDPFAPDDGSLFRTAVVVLALTSLLGAVEARRRRRR